MTQKEVQYIDHANIHTLPKEEREVFEVLLALGDNSILPEKDRQAKLFLLRIRLRKQIEQLLALQPKISFKNALMTLMNKLPDDFGDAELRVVVELVSEKWPAMPQASMADKVAGHFENQDT